MMPDDVDRFMTIDCSLISLQFIFLSLLFQISNSKDFFLQINRLHEMPDYLDIKVTKNLILGQILS